jgi:uncharacterized protein YbjT (DUF2867 family)
MKIVVIGGTGLIGSKLKATLSADGYNAVAAAPETGVDVSNSPSFEDAAVLRFFETSTRNLLMHEAAAGVGHHVALSIVGTDRVPDSGYLRAKSAQEQLIKQSSIPYSIVRATQFFEFLKRIADDATAPDNSVHVAPVFFQPMAAADVAAALHRVAVDSALHGTIEIAGPERFRFDAFIRQGLAALGDARKVVADPHARYFGAELAEYSLVPGDGARLGNSRFEDWIVQSAAAPAAVGGR